MLFNSWVFLAFALVVFPAYWLLPHRWQNRLLLVASYVFYGWWDWRFLALLGASTTVDFLIGLAMGREADQRRRRRLLLVSLVFNLGLLGFFKYFNFFAASLVAALGGAGFASAHHWHLDIVLPVGISFYVFQSLSYTIDVYRGQLKPTRSLPDFALFVSFFPQLVAGPIERAVALLPQMEAPRTVTRTRLIEGAWLVTWGLFKKVVVADNLAILVDKAFGAGATPGGLVCLLALYAFAYQIYCDFSGYSDMARGFGKWMGVELMINFDRPYLATNPSDFWHRWHISLSTWLRDYLYIPLGGSRGSALFTYRNLFLTMLLGGLWHGAAWTFVAWGAYHGALLAIHRWIRVDRGWRAPSGRVWEWAARIGWFHLVAFGWLLFRARDMAQVGGFVRAIGSSLAPTAAAAELIASLVLFAGALWAVDAWIKNACDPRTRPGWNAGLGPLAMSALLGAAILFSPPVGHAFIYFQF